MSTEPREHKKGETHTKKNRIRLNWLRAAVLGANDGIVSTAALVLGVAGSNASSGSVFVAGIAGMFAGAMSMALGEYVSVSMQRDTERALLEKEKARLSFGTEHGVDDLAAVYEAKGLSADTAHRVAEELTARDEFAAHVDVELGIIPDSLTNPFHAAIASATSFMSGSIIPLLAITLPSEGLRVPLTFVSALIALSITGTWSAQMGGANKLVVATRVVAGGVAAMGIIYGIGLAFGALDL